MQPPAKPSMLGHLYKLIFIRPDAAALRSPCKRFYEHMSLLCFDSSFPMSCGSRFTSHSCRRCWRPPLLPPLRRVRCAELWSSCFLSDVRHVMSERIGNSIRRERFAESLE